MSKIFPEFKSLDLSALSQQMLHFWKEESIFEKSITARENNNPFVFFEGPPSANGKPGIHHVMARAIKDIFCRYKTQQGFKVNRKAGWDTHGLPVELSVEKELGITKEDIGKTISIEAYNRHCRESVMKYTDLWNDLTEKVGYWVDMDKPYITYDNKYIESVWWLLKNLYEKDLIYKGYTIQPYSPKAGTGLSSHELNQPGTYRDVKDTSITAQFLLKETPSKQKIVGSGEVFLLAWTTTPWTLPSNTALTIGKNITYALIKTYNVYTGKEVRVVLAKDLLAKYLKPEWANKVFEAYKLGDKEVPYQLISELKGADLVGLTYHQLIPLALPVDKPEQAFRVIEGDFVTTEDGTGIVHTAPTFGADDARVAKVAGVPAMLVLNTDGEKVPLVDLTGKFIQNLGFLSGKYVKNEYYERDAPEKSVDVEIAIHLKEENRAFKVEKYEHSYPHCWRTDKPILYYPLDSWFVKSTAAKDKMVELNKTIRWKPESTGTGRFGNWLENLQDWNLSRSRYWGIPLPIWRTEDGKEVKCIGSMEELKTACGESVSAGLMKENPLSDFTPGNYSTDNYNKLDLHRPFVDDIVLVSSSGMPMKRELDLIDVWFDSGSMPYAQWHYPFENKDFIDKGDFFPADFIAEGVDQTRGWFFTLHAIGTMCFDSIAYKAVVSNGLVLDKNGQKMSKRLGNAVDPFETLEKYGPDATRFYMITNAQPWDNLKFDQEGIVEVQRKFFRALHNTYAFFALYANVDGFDNSEKQIPISQRAEIDCWILSKLNSLIETVTLSMDDFEPTKAGRAIQDFVVDDLSNWYVRLSRKRFWRGDYSADKIAAYQTLYTCMLEVSKLVAPICPFYADYLFGNLTKNAVGVYPPSVHLSDFPKADTTLINQKLEAQMSIAQRASSLVLSLRKREKIKVRQPLQKIMIPVLNNDFKNNLEKVKDLILTEVNVKELEVLDSGNEVFVKTIKPNFKTLGPKFGKQMKLLAAKINILRPDEIAVLETQQKINFTIENQGFEIGLEDVEISTGDIPGYMVAGDGYITVALDVNIGQNLMEEGLARELVNRIQNYRKDQGLDVTDHINLKVKANDLLIRAINNNLNYICSETLVDNLTLVEDIQQEGNLMVDIEKDVQAIIAIEKIKLQNHVG